MLTCLFEGWISRSNNNGGTFYCPGERRVYIDRIPESAPQDWNTGPKQKAGAFGAYLEHLHYPEKHGYYAFHVANTELECAQAVGSYFRERRSEWKRSPVARETEHESQAKCAAAND